MRDSKSLLASVLMLSSPATFLLVARLSIAREKESKDLVDSEDSEALSELFE